MQIEDDDSEMEFQDAHDYFDLDIVNQVGKLNIEEKENENQVQKAETKKKKQRQIIITSICIPKIKIQILEAQEDNEKDLFNEFKQKLGGAISLSKFDFRIKGSPFLELDITKIDIRRVDQPLITCQGVFVQKISLTNVEKRGEPKIILKSSNMDYFTNYDSTQLTLDGRDAFVGSFTEETYFNKQYNN